MKETDWTPWDAWTGTAVALASSTAVNWADVALAGGYCDQAHLANEFRNFSGISPAAYLAGEGLLCARRRSVE